MAAQPHDNDGDEHKAAPSSTSGSNSKGSNHRSREKSRDKHKDKSRQSSSKKKNRSKSSKRKHRRKLSNASIMSIDPYSLLQLKQQYESKSVDLLGTNNQNGNNGNGNGNINNNNNNNNNNMQQSQIQNMNDPTNNSSQYNNDLSRAYQNLIANSNNNNPLEQQKEKLLREMAEETIKISILQPKLDQCAREYEELWDEKELVEMALEESKRQNQMLKEEYDAKLEELESKMEDLMTSADDREHQLTVNENIIKEEYRDTLTSATEKFEMEIKKYEFKIEQKTNELEQAYSEITTLREAVELREHENNQMQKQINEANKLNQRYRMLQRKFDEATREIDDLRNQLFRAASEIEDLREHARFLQETIDQQNTDIQNRPVSSRGLEPEFLGGNNNSQQKRGSIEMDKSSTQAGLQAPLHIKNQKSQNVATVDLASEMNKMNSNSNLNNASQTGSPRQYDLSEEQKVVDDGVLDVLSHKSNDTSQPGDAENDNGSDNDNNNVNGNNDGAPTSWQEVQAGFNRKQSTVRGKQSQSKRTMTSNTSQQHERNNANVNIDTIDEFSMLSQYSSSETNIGDTLDDMNGDIKQMKEILRELVDNYNVNNMNGGGNAQMSTDVSTIKRAVRQIQIMMSKDYHGNINRTFDRNERKDDHHHDIDYDDYPGNEGPGPDSDRSSSGGSSSQGVVASWVTWIFGDLADSRMNPPKKSLVREYGPPLAFSSIIIAAAYLIIVYHKGYNIFGQPRVLRKK